MELQTGDDDAGRRLDRILRKALPDRPLSLIHRLLRQGRVLVDGRTARPDDRVPAGAMIAIPLDGAASRRNPRSRPSLSALPEIIWQGAGLLVLNKPAGLAVHGRGSLDTLVQAHLAGTLAASLSFRPGPLHRLDKPTSGLIVFSTTLAGARFFSELMRGRRLTKTYLAIVEGCIETGEVWEDDLIRDEGARKTFAAGPDAATDAVAKAAPDAVADAADANAAPDAATAKAKPAVTSIQPLASSGGYTLIRADIGTGRTHQIRAHAAAHGHPLAGDVKYGGHALSMGQDGGNRRGGGFLLHAWKLEFGEAGPDQESPLPPALCAPVPEAFQARVSELFPAADIAL